MKFRALSRGRKLVLGLTTIALALAGVASAHPGLRSRLSAAGLFASPAPAPAPQEGFPPEATEWLVVRATPYGFTPDEVSIAPGQTKLVILNRTGNPTVDFTLTDPSSTEALSKQGIEQDAYTLDLVTFDVGTWTITESSSRDAVCTITVTR